MAPVKKKAKLSFRVVNDLADNDLAHIFKYLPPYERLIASEVCSRWHGLSRKAWLDIKHLDLSPIPGKCITAIIKQCPRLQSVFALKKSFGLRELTGLCKNPNISCVKFYDCKFQLELTAGSNIHSVLVEIFSDQLARASWTEFVLYDAQVDQPRTPNSPTPLWTLDCSCLPVSLTRLELCGVYTTWRLCPVQAPILIGIETLQNLECLILRTTPKARGGRAGCEFIYCTAHYSEHEICDQIAGLNNLRELCLGPVTQNLWKNPGGILALPRLEVLLLHDVISNEWVKEDLEWLLTKNSLLRILVLTGKLPVDGTEAIALPARKRFPNGFGADPLPLLHVFVADEAACKIRFTEASSDALLVHRIDAPLPELLVRSDIAQLFEGVWVAEKIKETAKYEG